MTAWLVERRISELPAYWTGSGWSPDAEGKAVRFCRKADVDRMILINFTTLDRVGAFAAPYEFDDEP